MSTLLRADYRPPRLSPAAYAEHIAATGPTRKRPQYPHWYRPFDVDPTRMRSSRVRVGLDLDGVFYDFAHALRHYLVEHLGWNAAGLDAPTRWEFYLDWHLTYQEFTTLCDQAVEAGVLFTVGAPTPGSIAAAHRLYGAGAELHIITARDFGPPGASKAATRGWLERERLPYNSLTLAHDKTCVWTDYMVEDRLENYDALEDAGTEVWLLNQPWNQVPGDQRRRIDTLAEFADAVIADMTNQVAADHRTPTFR